MTIPETRLTVLPEDAIKEAIEQQFTTFITGMATGVDLVAAETVLRLRERDSRIKLIAALPYPDFGLHWRGGWTERFQAVLSAAGLKRCICPRFSYSAYQARNEWMVNHSGLVIAVFGGGKGGTKNTLDFAEKKRVPCVIIDSSGKM